MTPSVRLRPVAESDLVMFQRFLTEPGLIGLDWTGFRDAQEPARRFATDGYLGTEQSRLIVEVGGGAAAERIQAGTHPENTAEQRALEKAGFRREGVLRAVEFRAGRWCDGWLYSRLRGDPSPL